MDIAVLLSTKNGARFVREQVDSIMMQTHPRKQVFWRDDGSTDDTVRLLQDVFHLRPYGTTPMGVTASYAHLLRIAVERGYQRFALADQDDIWGIDKLDRGYQALAPYQSAALYCARQSLVDVNLHPIGTSPLLSGPIGFPASLTQNIATGCTVMFNRPAAELVVKTWQAQPFHDWWCYIIVSAAGGQIVVDDAEVMQYRQHSANLVGAPRNFAARAITAFQRGPQVFMRILRTHVAALQQYRDMLTPDTCKTLDIIANALQGNARAKWHALQLPGFRRQTAVETLLFRLWFITG